MRKPGRATGFAIGLVAGTGLALLFLVWAVPAFRDPVKAVASYADHRIDAKGNDQQSAEPISGRYFTTRDTIAQWIAAFTSAGSAFISVWAVLLVRGTLNETRRTAIAAESQIAVAREIGEAQTRAYLRIAEGRLATEPDWTQCMLRIENSGQSPAIRTTAKARLSVKTQVGLQVTWHVGSETEASAQLIPAGAEGELIFVFSNHNIPTDMLAALSAPDADYAIEGALIWLDVFGREIAADFRLSRYARSFQPLFKNAFDWQGRLYAYNQARKKSE